MLFVRHPTAAEFRETVVPHCVQDATRRAVACMGVSAWASGVPNSAAEILCAADPTIRAAAAESLVVSLPRMRFCVSLEPMGLSPYGLVNGVMMMPDVMHPRTVLLTTDVMTACINAHLGICMHIDRLCASSAHIAWIVDRARSAATAATDTTEDDDGAPASARTHRLHAGRVLEWCSTITEAIRVLDAKIRATGCSLDANACIVGVHPPQATFRGHITSDMPCDLYALADKGPDSGTCSHWVSMYAQRLVNHARFQVASGVVMSPVQREVSILVAHVDRTAHGQWRFDIAHARDTYMHVCNAHPSALADATAVLHTDFVSAACDRLLPSEHRDAPRDAAAAPDDIELLLDWLRAYACAAVEVAHAAASEPADSNPGIVYIDSDTAHVPVRAINSRAIRPAAAGVHLDATELVSRVVVDDDMWLAPPSARADTTFDAIHGTMASACMLVQRCTDYTTTTTVVAEPTTATSAGRAVCVRPFLARALATVLPHIAAWTRSLVAQLAAECNNTPPLRTQAQDDDINPHSWVLGAEHAIPEAWTAVAADILRLCATPRASATATATRLASAAAGALQAGVMSSFCGKWHSGRRSNAGVLWMRVAAGALSRMAPLPGKQRIVLDAAGMYLGDVPKPTATVHPMQLLLGAPLRTVRRGHGLDATNVRQRCAAAVAQLVTGPRPWVGLVPTANPQSVGSGWVQYALVAQCAHSQPMLAAIHANPPSRMQLCIILLGVGGTHEEWCSFLQAVPLESLIDALDRHRRRVAAACVVRTNTARYAIVDTVGIDPGAAEDSRFVHDGCPDSVLNTPLLPGSIPPMM